MKVFHGGEKEISKINFDIILKSNGKQEFGFGFYVSSDLDLSDRYGSIISKFELNIDRFVDSETIVDNINRIRLNVFMLRLREINSEAFYFMMSDYGFENINNIKGFINCNKNLSLPNFQLNLLDYFHYKEVNSGFIEILGIDGFSKNDSYCILNERCIKKSNKTDIADNKRTVPTMPSITYSKPAPVKYAIEALYTDNKDPVIEAKKELLKISNKKGD